MGVGRRRGTSGRRGQINLWRLSGVDNSIHTRLAKCSIGQQYHIKTSALLQDTIHYHQLWVASTTTTIHTNSSEHHPFEFLPIIRSADPIPVDSDPFRVLLFKYIHFVTPRSFSCTLRPCSAVHSFPRDVLYADGRSLSLCGWWMVQNALSYTFSLHLWI